jgi:hypothetical protein
MKLRITNFSSSIPLIFCLTFYATSSSAVALLHKPFIDDATQTSQFFDDSVHSFQDIATLIRGTYEANLYKLPAFSSGHYGLRMYRQTLDNKYAAAIWSDMARVASQLNMFANEVYTPEQIKQYSIKRVDKYLIDANERGLLRYEATKSMPEYVYVGVALLGSMARANEYGLKHRDDEKLREIIRRYDFVRYVTDETMVKAWAAQLANQVFWLRQLGEQDVVDVFIKTFRNVYPDANDAGLSKQQYGNKIYGLTHIIFAASGYYRYKINEQDYQWIFDYYRHNIDNIIARAKEDVIAEVGISFLLAGLDDDPVVLKTRKVIQKAFNKKYGLVPSITGEVDLKKGEHRNVLAIMLLDWKGVNDAPKVSKQPAIFVAKPYGLLKI